ncbi:MAG: TylF/MycF/NovP-related O-methyltransferase [Candidatus Micrarchaeia archaeon]
MRYIKKTCKQIIGSCLYPLVNNKIAIASLLEKGLIIAPDYYKSAYKSIDIKKLPEFAETAKKVIETGKTCLYYDRLYTIYQAILNLSSLKQKIFAVEIGVYKGGASLFISEMLNKFAKNGWELHSFDTFEGHHQKDISKEDTIHKPHMFSDTSYEEVKNLLCKYKTTYYIKEDSKILVNL